MKGVRAVADESETRRLKRIFPLSEKLGNLRVIRFRMVPVDFGRRTRQTGGLLSVGVWTLSIAAVAIAAVAGTVAALAWMGGVIT